MRSARSEEELAQVREVETKSLLDNFTRQRQILYRNADMSFAIKDLAGERAAISEAGKVTERIAKLLGELSVGNVTVNQQINLIQSPMWHQIRTALVRELRPLGPQAIAACGRAIEAAEAAINLPMESTLPAIEAA
ncbi:hypothetical protein [Luteibacter sp. UNCMF331Sha3.1]|uniref:hypothetical protein n=1 Tax=Luteibacter sp. UNCMF331Sha3.1 TaxID=1502760 RepID=UPI001113A1B9|nr:hypothetical protein [Luteibacter sp. UNCMF331Sha3.1]